MVVDKDNESKYSSNIVQIQNKWGVDLSFKALNENAKYLCVNLTPPI